MANRNQQYHDPFEPGVSSPEFQQYARENYSAHGGNRARSGAVGGQAPYAGGTARMSGAGGGRGAAGDGAYGAANGRDASGVRGGYGSSFGGAGTNGGRQNPWSRPDGGTSRMPGGSAAAGGAGRGAANAYTRPGRHAAAQPRSGWASPSDTGDMGFAGSAGAYTSPAKRFAGLLVCVLVAVAIEVFGFNLAFFTSMTYPEVGSYLVNGVASGSEGTIALDASNNAIELTGLDDTVRSIHFAPVLNDPATAAKATDSKLQVTMYLADEGNANYYQLPSVTVDPADAASTYISLDPAGKCHSVYVSFTNLADVGPITVTGVSLNQQVPLDIDPVRFAYILAVLLLLYAVRPQSMLFSRVFDGRITRHGWMVVGLVAVQAVIIFVLVMSNTHFLSLTQTASTGNYFQYQKLAQALLQGHLYLDDVPSAALQAMDNPYDTAARAAAGVPYLWDHAYFEGKYYVYFGVLPCLVFYVPWLLATGTGFPTWLGVAICDCAYAAGLAYLLTNVVRRWFPRTSLGLFAVLDIMLFVAGGGLILARTPSMYFLPEAMGLALVSWGLGLWISGTSRGYIERGRVVAGAALIALTLAARPQMVLAAVFGLVLFWPFLRDARGNAQARRACLHEFRAALVPFAVVALVVMAYNFLRFGSPLDFGANYNLTTNDMTHRGFHADRIPFGLYAYLLQPPALGSQFPFLHQTYMDPSYQGVTIYEPMFGGYFFLYPMTLVLLALPRVRHALKAKGLLPLWACLVVVAVALCVFDLQGAGILMRYICDFGLYFALAAALVFLELLQVRSTEPLSKGWTTQLGAHGVAPVGQVGAHAMANASAAGETVSVYRIALYFLFGSLVVMITANALLWNAFGMY